MPTTVKSSAQYAELGDLSVYSVATSAIPVDTADSSGAIPTISATFVDGTDVEYLIGEDFSLSNPSVGKYNGEVVNVGKTAGSNRYTLDVHTVMTRLNTEHRLFPLADYNGTDSTYLPCMALEYWTQQCGIFYSAVPGDVLFFQSQWGHYGAFAKDITRPLKSKLTSASGFNFQAFVNEGRLMNSFPRNAEATLTFPAKTTLTDMGSYLPVLIPSTPSTDVAVFGGTIGLYGTGRQGTITWKMIGPRGTKRQIKVTADTATGFTLATSEDGISFTTRGSVAAPTGTYTFFVGVSETTGGTKFDFSVLNSDSTLHGSTTATAAGSAIKGSLSLTQVLYRGEDVGSGDPLLYADVFISLMSSVPTARPVVQKSITTGTKATSFLIGFSGNVWEHMKQYCSIYHLDVNYRDGKLTFEPRQRDIKVGSSLSELNTRIQAREQARNVEVVNYQHTATGSTPRVMWKADSVYQVAVGEVQEFTVQTDHSIMEMSQPVCVSGINPFPYVTGAGQYVVTGSDGYIVSPAFWNDQGGSITCDITDTEGEIKVRIKGPDFDSDRAPYRISEGDAGRPALYLTGTGVMSDAKTLKVPTGKSKAAKDVGVTIDSPFIGNAKHAYDAAVRAARAFATPEITTSFVAPVSYDEISNLGTVPTGSLVKRNGNIFRVTDATQTHSTLSGSATQHNTIYQLKRSYPPVQPPEGMSGAEVIPKIGEMNDYNAGKPIGKVNLKPLKEVK